MGVRVCIHTSMTLCICASALSSAPAFFFLLLKNPIEALEFVVG